MNQRLSNFTSLLNELKTTLCSSEFNHIQRVIFTVGMGRRGRIDELWLAYYLPSILSVSREFKNKAVCIVVNKEVFSKLEVKYKGNAVMTNLLKPSKI